jgi:cytochrome P450
MPLLQSVIDFGASQQWYLPGKLAVILICIAALAAVRFSRAKRQAAIAAQHGCKPIKAQFPHVPLSFGLDFIIQNVRAFRRNGFLELLRSRHAAYGTTFTAKALNRRGIFTIEPENVKTVLAGRFQDYCLGDRPPIMGQLLGRGIFVSDGEDWSHSRALLRPNFVKDQIADLSLINGHIEDLLKVVQDGQLVDLQPLFLHFTLDSATEFLFGRSTNLLGTNDAADKAFSDAFNASLKHMALQFRMGPLRKLVRRTPEVEQAHQICRAYVDRFVDSAMTMRQRATEKTPAEIGRNFFLRELAESTDDKEKIRDEILNILIAGRDTVASLLSSMFFVLARRPDIWRKVKEEISQLNGELPTYDQLRDLKYIRYCINEGERHLKVM